MKNIFKLIFVTILVMVFFITFFTFKEKPKKNNKKEYFDQHGNKVIEAFNSDHKLIKVTKYDPININEYDEATGKKN